MHIVPLRVAFLDTVQALSLLLTGSDASSEHSLGSHSTGSEISSKNTLLATDSSAMKKALHKFAGDDMRIDNVFFNPDALWKRDQAGWAPQFHCS